jgi:hypothetical protein
MHEEWCNPDIMVEFEDIVLFYYEMMYIHVLLKELKLHSHMYISVS